MMTIRKIIFLLAALPLLWQGCAPKGNQNSGKQEESAPLKSASVAAPVAVNQEAQLLLKALEEGGDYVNSREFPSLIKASVVYEELGGNNHIIDLRPAAEYARGHIRGAVSVPFEGLPEYLETKIKPFEFGKIILVCQTGQTSGYATSLLRMMGYGNTYALRWGMSSWNSALAAEYWMQGLSSDFEGQLEGGDVPAAPPGDLPQLNTGLSSGDEILDLRFRRVMAEGSQPALITAAEVFADPSKYYIINFERKDKYESGHIPGAVRYKPAATLGILEEMQTIPADKTIVLYCGTGHNSAFASAYLRIFGYDAKTLMYGNNAFMINKMVKERAALSWLPFTADEVHDYETVR